MMKKPIVQDIGTRQDAVIALKFRGKNTDRTERLAIIQKAAEFVPVMAKLAMNKDKQAGLL